MIMKHFCQSSTVSKLFDNKDPAMVLRKGACISLLSLCWSSLQGRQGRRFRSKNLVSLSLDSCDRHSAAGHKLHPSCRLHRRMWFCCCPQPVSELVIIQEDIVTITLKDAAFTSCTLPHPINCLHSQPNIPSSSYIFQNCKTWVANGVIDECYKQME